MLRRSLTLCAAFAALCPNLAHSQATSVYSFPPTSAEPVGAPVISSNGTVYGATYSGTGSGATCVTGTACGTFFQLTPPATQGGSWTQTTLYSFKGASDGAAPNANPIYINGVFYGTTYGGGNPTIGSGRGTVYAMVPDGSGGFTHVLIYAFNGSTDGLRPTYLVGMNDKIYGITNFGGTFQGGTDTGAMNMPGSDATTPNRSGDGTVFELTPPATGSGTGWTEAIVHDFALTNDGAYPQFIVASGGSLWVSCSNGGPGNGGTIVKLTPPSSGSGPWTEDVVYAFSSTGTNSFNPEGFTFGADGNIYGVNEVGGGGSCRYYYYKGCGAVYQLTNSGSFPWSFSTIYNFTGASDSSAPYAPPIFDPGGNLWVTSTGAANRPDTAGAVLKLTPGQSAWTTNIVYTFQGANGDEPGGALTLNPADGNYYGFTIRGGATGSGTMYSPNTGGGTTKK